MTNAPFNVGLIGLGTVGTGVARVLLENAENLARRAGRPVVLRRASDLDLTRDRGLTFPAGVLTTNAQEILDDPEVHAVVEVIGGVNPARRFIEAALRSGKHVVTSNKEVIAKHGREFVELARQHGVTLYYEASAGGGIPIIHALKNCLAANNIRKIFGILNGTTNFILTKMHEEGADFDAVLAEAQQLGYAEANPSNDVDGYDVAYKLSILASIAFNAHFRHEDIYREGIRRITSDDIRAAREFGYVIKLLAIGVEHGPEAVELRVHPVMLPADHPLATVSGSFNAIFVEGNYVGETMFYGRGAGQLPTASAVVGDLLDLAMAPDRAGSHPSMTTFFHEKKVLPMGELSNEYYLRVTVKDQVGVLAALTSICRDCHVSIKSVHQTARGDTASIVIITHQVREAAMQEALRHIQVLDAIRHVNSLIRVGV